MLDPWGCGRSEHTHSFTVLGLEDLWFHVSRSGGKVKSGQDMICGVKVSQALV